MSDFALNLMLGVQYARKLPTKAADKAHERMQRSALPGRSDEAKVADRAFFDGVMSQLASKSRCLRCGKKLSDPTSIERGIGSDCLAKVGGDVGWAAYREAVGLRGAS